MTKQYFVQYTDPSIFHHFRLPQGIFCSIDIGIRNMKPDFLYASVRNVLGFPVVFVLETAVFESTEKTLLEMQAIYIKDKKDMLIVRVESLEILEAVCKAACELAANGLSVFVFKGDGLTEKDCLISRNNNGLIEFPSIDFSQLETFIEVSEVGLTFFTTNENYNSPAKIVQYMPSTYEVDGENSDID